MKITKEIHLGDKHYVHQLDDVNVSLEELEDAIKDFKSKKGLLFRESRIGNSDYQLIRYHSSTYQKAANAVFIEDNEGVNLIGDYGWTLVTDWKLKDTNQLKEELISLFNIRF